MFQYLHDDTWLLSNICECIDVVSVATKSKLQSKCQLTRNFRRKNFDCCCCCWKFEFAAVCKKHETCSFSFFSKVSYKSYFQVFKTFFCLPIFCFHKFLCFIFSQYLFSFQFFFCYTIMKKILSERNESTSYFVRS